MKSNLPACKAGNFTGLKKAAFALAAVVVLGASACKKNDAELSAANARAGGERLPGTESVEYGRAFIAAADSFYCFEAYTGQMFWKAKYNPNISSCAVDNANNLVFTRDRTDLVAASTITGAEVWRYKTPGRFTSTPQLYNGTIFFGSEDQFVYALDAANGKYKWSVRTLSNVTGSPTVYKDHVYVGSGDGYLYAINIYSGLIKWVYNVGTSIYTNPTAANDIIYCNAGNGYLHAISVVTGKLVWKHPITTRWNTSPTISNGIVFVHGDKSLYAINATTGIRLWEFSTGIALSGSPIVFKNEVYTFDYNYIYAIDVNTSKVTKVSPADEFYGDITSLTVASLGIKDIVYLSGYDRKSTKHHLFAFDATDLSLLWKKKLRDQTEVDGDTTPRSSPVISTPTKVYHSAVSGSQQ